MSNVKDSILEFLRFVDYKHQNNQLASWYRNLIAPSPELKKQLVETDPELAQRCFYLFRDRELGEIFIGIYKNDPSRHHSAYHISVELGYIGRRIGYLAGRIQRSHSPRSRENLTQSLAAVLRKYSAEADEIPEIRERFQKYPIERRLGLESLTEVSGLKDVIRLLKDFDDKDDIGRWDNFVVSVLADVDTKEDDDSNLENWWDDVVRLVENSKEG